MPIRVDFHELPSLNVEFVALLLRRTLMPEGQGQHYRFNALRTMRELHAVGGKWGALASLLDSWLSETSCRETLQNESVTSLVPLCYDIAMDADPLPNSFKALLRPIWRDVLTAFSSSIRRDRYLLLRNGPDRLFDDLRIGFSYATSHSWPMDPGATERPGVVYLVPSTLWTFQPVLVDRAQDDRAYVIYAAIKPQGADSAIQRPHPALAQLIGWTRAAILHSLTSPMNTSFIAEKLHISLPSASRHATVLRQAGLISSHRCSQGVEHYPTWLGRELVHTTEWLSGVQGGLRTQGHDNRIYQYLLRG